MQAGMEVALARLHCSGTLSFEDFEKSPGKLPGSLRLKLKGVLR
jgi:hypothetical protein